MKNLKFYRLLLGITILFSIFLFQGTSSEESCGGDDGCLDELIDAEFAYLRIYNHTGHKMVAIVAARPDKDKPSKSYNFEVEKGVTVKRVTIDPGYIMAFGVVYSEPRRPIEGGFVTYYLDPGETGVLHCY